MALSDEEGFHDDMEQPSINSDSPEDEALIKTTPVIQQTPSFVYFLTAFAAIGGFLFGYDTGVISGAMILIKEEFHLTPFWQELVVSVTIGTAIVGSFFGGFLNQRFGRKPMLITSAMVFTIGATVMGVAQSRVVLLIGRLTVGFGIGGASVTVPVYIAETAPSKTRGRMVTVNNLFITGGQFVAAVVDGFLSPYKRIGWRLMLGLAAVPSIIMFFGCLILPESPRWLVSKGYDDEAFKVLKKLRGSADVSSELRAMQEVCEETASAENTGSCTESRVYQILTSSAMRRAILVGCVLQAVQQLSGINTVMYYSATIIQMSGIQGDQLAIWLAAVVAFGNFSFTIVGVYLVERMGRRKLLLGSLAVVVLSLFLLGGAFYLADKNDPAISLRELPSHRKNSCPSTGHCLDCLGKNCGFCYDKDAMGNPANGSCVAFRGSNYHAAYGRCNKSSTGASWAYTACPYKFAWFAIVALMLYIAGFAPGMGPMPWTINSEIYPLWARSTGNAFATATNWSFNLLISITFLSLTEWVTPYGTFWLYGGIALSGWVFFYIFVPETKGKSLEELEHLFAR
ncbi:proton myo-inositol cotransporter-like isoform X1 [Acropora muricata]|uniref:proton myo-inositol cotransporter-like isoform X1 n=1 Tax=Acropora muricata TaxID=159855 RepID=UPI0034E5E527